MLTNVKMGGGKIHSPPGIAFLIVQLFIINLITLIIMGIRPHQLITKSLFFLVLLFTFHSAAGQINVPLITENVPPQPIGDRSLWAVPTVVQEITFITVSFPLSTVSEVQIIDKCSDEMVYSDEFADSRCVIIDLADEGLEEGIYTLRIYAFGKWWWGEFEIENE